MYNNKKLIFLDQKQRNQLRFSLACVHYYFFSRLHCLHAVLLLPFKIFLVEGVDSINHDLDQLDLRVSKTMLVGDVISAASLATRFSTGTTGLDSKFFTASLKFVNRFLGPAREVNMDRGTHTSSQVDGAGVDESVLLRESIVLSRFSLYRVSNSLDTTSKAFEDTLNISSLLHGDYTGLIFFIDPEKECFGIIVEDTTTLRPVTFHTSNSKVTISAHEEEVIINKLLANLFIHTSERIVFSSKISS